ncbi:MAG: Maf-like protein [Pseudomonadota bacterium]
MSHLILASKSAARAEILKNAGLSFEISAADIDERAVEMPLLTADFSPADIAAVLAEAKALDVSTRHPGATIIGADQTMSFRKDGERHRFNKPVDMDAARKQLLALRRQTHSLHSAVVCARDGQTIWRHADDAHLIMRDLSPEFVGRYLSAVGEKALQSVGCYQLEGRGIQLFEKITGDYFTILGLPLLPLLAFLRGEGFVE